MGGVQVEVKQLKKNYIFATYLVVVVQRLRLLRHRWRELPQEQRGLLLILLDRCLINWRYGRMLMWWCSLKDYVSWMYCVAVFFPLSEFTANKPDGYHCTIRTHHFLFGGAFNKPEDSYFDGFLVPWTRTSSEITLFEKVKTKSK